MALGISRVYPPPTHKKAMERITVSSRLYHAVMMIRKPGVTGASRIPRSVRIAITALSGGMKLDTPLTLDKVVARRETRYTDAPSEDSVSKHPVNRVALHKIRKGELEEQVGEVAVYERGSGAWRAHNPVESQAKSFPTSPAPVVRSKATLDDSEILSAYCSSARVHLCKTHLEAVCRQEQRHDVPVDPAEEFAFLLDLFRGELLVDAEMSLPFRLFVGDRYDLAVEVAETTLVFAPCLDVLLFIRVVDRGHLDELKCGE